jgi:hypothetical protein
MALHLAISELIAAVRALAAPTPPPTYPIHRIHFRLSNTRDWFLNAASRRDVAFGGLTDGPHRDSKANLKKGFLVLDISGTPLHVRKAPGLSSIPGGPRCPTGQPRVSPARRDIP